MADSTADILVAKEPNNREQIQLTLASGQKVYANCVAALNTTTGKVVNGTGGNPALLVIGRFFKAVDASATGTNADTPCLVKLDRPINGRWFANDTVAPVTSAYVGRVVYLKDNQTVTLTSTANSVAGLCWGVSTSKGVLVEALPVVATQAVSATVPTQVANTTVTTWAPTGASLVNGATYLINATTGFTGAATVTLPTAGAAAGLSLRIILDGTHGQTVTVRDNTTAITGALSASVRQFVSAVNVGDATTALWVVSAYANAA